MATELLLGARWQCAPVAAGRFEVPSQLGALSDSWMPATVPGTAAGALRSAGTDEPAIRDYDREDWWFRCLVPGGSTGPGAGESAVGPLRLRFGSLATIAEVFWNGGLVARSENQFVPVEVEVEGRPEGNELAIRFCSLSAALSLPRKRPRWKTYLVEHQNLRFLRTSLLGRLPGWASVPPAVGPLRSVSLTPRSDPAVTGCHLRARPLDSGGLVEATLRVRPGEGCAFEAPVLRCGGAGAEMAVLEGGCSGGELVLVGSIQVPEVDLWWPRTHGDQPLYPVFLEHTDGQALLGKVGFRSLEVDREDGRFCVVVNGVEVFCRGATWFPPDPVARSSSREELRRALMDAVDASMNMVRVPAVSGYEETRFFELCDELGLLVWQECPFAFMDPPEEDGFESVVEAELRGALSSLSLHPSLAIVCGSQQTEEIPAMSGLAPGRYGQPLIDQLIPAICEDLLPGTAYVSSEPSGGALPFQMNEGVSQYFGVGGYLRPIEDVRRAGVRFAAECLALATPPPPSSVELLGGAYLAGHDPSWKLGVHHDAGRSWDMEDVRDLYVRQLFGIDPLLARYTDAEAALELGRATNAELMSAVFTEWRRPGSSCDGGLVLALRDLRLGAGWGLVDARGRRKAPWYALRRIFQPLALLVTDEGLNGLDLHVVNDGPDRFSGSISLALYARGSLLTERASCPVELRGRGGLVVGSSELLDGFRDVSYAYRFAPPAHDVVVASLEDAKGQTVSEVVFLPLGQCRPREEHVGLRGVARPGQDGQWELEVTTERFAQWVHHDLDGFVADDDWFHVVPGRPRKVMLRPEEPARKPEGSLQALNAVQPSPIVICTSADTSAAASADAGLDGG